MVTAAFIVVSIATVVFSRGSLQSRRCVEHRQSCVTTAHPTFGASTDAPGRSAPLPAGRDAAAVPQAAAPVETGGVGNPVTPPGMKLASLDEYKRGKHEFDIKNNIFYMSKT